MDIIHNKNPYVFTKPDILTIGGCRFRSYQTDQYNEEEQYSKLAPYNDNDGKNMTIEVYDNKNSEMY